MSDRYKFSDYESNELGRYFTESYFITNNFPDNKVSVYLVTWNMHNSEKAFDFHVIRKLLFPSMLKNIYDLYIIGTQEAVFSKKRWARAIQQTLGKNYVLLVNHFLFDLQLLVFIKQELSLYISDVRTDIMIFGLTKFLKTKGSLATSFNLLGTSFLFINSHFIAHERNAKIRIKNYSHTIKKLKLTSASKRFAYLPFIGHSYVKDATDVFDNIFWFGDFNFRILDETKITIRNKIEERRRINKESFASVLAYDQLNQFMNDGTIFKGFKESRISFPPTYKYDVGTDTYDSSHKNRVPSYTDRIVFKNKTNYNPSFVPIECLAYQHISAIKCSDHKPVFGLFTTELHASVDTKIKKPFIKAIASAQYGNSFNSKNYFRKL